MKSFRALLGLAVAAFVLAQSQVQAASDIFIRLVTPGSGVPTYTGDSQNAQFKGSDGWFDASSVGFGMSNDTPVSGAGTGKAAADPVTAVKFPNSASAALFTACALGGHWDTAEIVFTKSSGATGKTEAYLKLELKLVVVTKLGMQMDSGDDLPREDVKLAYAAQRITFYKQNPDGTFTQTGQSTWSFTRNAAIFQA